MQGTPIAYDPRLTVAVLAAATVAIGWLVTFWLSALSEAKRRRQSSLDLQRALKAEVFDYSQALKDDAPEDTANAVRDQIITGGDDPETRHTAFVPRVSAPVVFDAVVGNITLLPEEPIDSVVQFYSLLSDVRLYAEDLMSADFKAMSAERRAGGLANYFELRQECYDISCVCLGALDASITKSVSRQKRLERLFGVAPYG